LPTILVAIPFGVIVSVQVGGLAQQIGASAFSGAVNGIGVLRQGAPLVTSLMIAGAVGSALTSDLGARTVREEVDALRVMGLNPVNRLVAPRLLAAIVVALVLNVIVAVTAIGTGYTINVPFADGATDGDYRLAFEEVIGPAAERFQPDLVLVSAGFDAHVRDPLGGMRLTEEGFADLCESIRSIAERYADGRLVLLLEGGYDLDGLRESVLACLDILGGAAPPGKPIHTSPRGDADVRAAILAHHAWRYG